MSTWLRFALVAVTLSLFATLVGLGHQDDCDWARLAETIFAKLRPTQSPALDAATGCADTALHPGSARCAPNDPVEYQSRSQQTDTDPPKKAMSHAVPRFGPADGSIRLAAANVDELSATGQNQEKFDLIVRNRDIHYVFNLLNSTGRIKIVALPSVKGTVTITLYDTTVEKALAAILTTHGYLSRADGDYTMIYGQEDLEFLDPQAGKIEVFTYKPRYIAANDLIQVLTPHLSEKGRISSTKANQVGIATNADNAGGDSLAVDDALVVQDNHATIERIKRIVAEIDMRPQQVLIEAVLLSVQLDDDHHLGVNFALLHENKQSHLGVFGNGSVINGAAGFPPSTIVSGAGKVQGAFATNEHGLKYAVINASITAFINLLETIGQTTVVASPKVLALNKQRAEIIVGSQLGYRTVTTTETAAVENVQFLDVGTQLRMRPFVQQDGYIRMELHPEKSSGKVSETTGLPEKDTTQVTTNLTVRSGETIVIGGLIQEQQQRSVQQVPFLGTLPLVGRLFRDETTTINRQEIIVLITPTIVDEDEEYCRARGEVARFMDRRESLEQSFPKCTRPALARENLQRACSYRDQGDIETALALVDLAIYCDPTYEPALELRRKLYSQILSEPATEAGSIPNRPLLLYPAPAHPDPAIK